MEQHYHNVAVLPRSLELLLFILHGVRIGSGVLLFFLGIGSIIYYDLFMAVYVMVLGIAASLSGFTGLLATKFKSLVAHGGCVATSAVTLYLGLLNYQLSFGLSHSQPAQNKINALFMCDVILTVIDIMISAICVGFQGVVLYISTKKV